MKNPRMAETLIRKATWVLYGSIGINTMLLISALAAGPKNPRSIGE